MEVVTSEGRFMADVASRYDFDEPLDVAPAVLEEFIARVGVMAAYPFVREAIHRTAARLRLPTPLLARACLLNLSGVVGEAGRVLRTDVISDDLWALVEPVMPDASGRRGRPWNDHCRTLEGIIWRFRTGSPWRDLPEQFGDWQSVAERHLRWSKDQTYSR